MKRSEKILLGLFGLVFLVIVGGGLGSYAWKNYTRVNDEIEHLRDKLADMHTAIAHGTEWQQKNDWLEGHVPTYTSHEEASSRILSTVQEEATKANVKLSSQMLPKPAVQEGDAMGYFDKASIKCTLNDADEKALFAWMHALYSRKSFIGITRMQITPSGQGKSVNCEVDVTQFYREVAAQKLSKAH